MTISSLIKVADILNRPKIVSYTRNTAQASLKTATYIQNVPRTVETLNVRDRHNALIQKVGNLAEIDAIMEEEILNVGYIQKFAISTCNDTHE